MHGFDPKERLLFSKQDGRDKPGLPVCMSTLKRGCVKGSSTQSFEYFIKHKSENKKAEHPNSWLVSSQVDSLKQCFCLLLIGVSGRFLLRVAHASHWEWMIHEAVLTRWPDRRHSDVLPVISHFLAHTLLAWGKCCSPPGAIFNTWWSHMVLFWCHVAFGSLLLSFLLNFCPPWHRSASDLCLMRDSNTQLVLLSNNRDQKYY